MLPDEVPDGGEVHSRKIPVEQVPIHEQIHSLLEFGIVIMNHSGPFKELLLGAEDFRVVFAGGELADHGLELGLHGFGHGEPIFTETGKLRNRVVFCSETGQVYGFFTLITDKKGLRSNLSLSEHGAMWHGSCSKGEQEIQYETV